MGGRGVIHGWCCRSEADSGPKQTGPGGTRPTGSSLALGISEKSPGHHSPASVRRRSRSGGCCSVWGVSGEGVEPAGPPLASCISPVEE